MTTIEEPAVGTPPYRAVATHASHGDRSTHRRRHRPALITVVVTIGSGATGLGRVTAAGGLAVNRQDDGVVVNDSSQVVNVCDGRIVSLQGLGQLNEQGWASSDPCAAYRDAPHFAPASVEFPAASAVDGM